MNRTVAIVAVMTTLLASVPLHAAEPMEPSGAAQMLMSDSPENFFENAASANMFEIEASKVALEKTQDPELRTFAEMMVKDHTEAGQKLTTLAASKNVTLPTELLRRHQMMLDGLKDEKPGEDFDDEYRMKMVASHKEAVSLFDESARESVDPEVRKFAGEMLPKLQMHGGQAEKLREKASRKD